MAARSEDRLLDTFRNILRLEQERKYANKAVYGGLDAFIKQWRTQLHAHLSEAADANSNANANPATDPDIGADNLLTSPYSAMSPQKRALWVKACLDRIGPTPGAASPPPQKPPAASNPDAQEPPRPKPSPTPEFLQKPVTSLRGVDTKTAEKLARLDVETVGDLLRHFPRYHKDYSRRAQIGDLKVGQDATVIATIRSAARAKLGRRNQPATRAVVGDGTGVLSITWFGNVYLARQLKAGQKIALSGKIDSFGGALTMDSPEYEIIREGIPLIHTGRLLPVHALTRDLYARGLRRIIWNALKDCAPAIQEFLPEETLGSVGLMPLPKAVFNAHFPDSADAYEEARSRLAFDELLLMQISVLQRRRQWRDAAQGSSITGASDAVEAFLQSLPFTLTGAQRRCVDETLADMAEGAPAMNRLLQGEVGSGKTVVAFAALLAVAAMGYQGTIMAPTEVLADQHFSTAVQLMGRLHNPVKEENVVSASIGPGDPPITVAIITGSTRRALRDVIQQQAANGEIDIIIGTHTLIQETMKVPKLALSVVDEQHRFGVMQRAALRGKGDASPHVLIMSATPIPRTLALTLYGDLDISTIDEMPPGRTPIVTRQVPPGKREAAYEFLRGQVLKGRQAFVIFPLIEESELTEAKAAAQEYERLSRQVFPDLRVGILHGRMAARKKDEVMTSFHNHHLDILVSTPVVEVGIDVPNASVMMVESADRFGLSQLHQFRGRVGRGRHKSFCLLLAEDPSDNARERLEAIEKYSDGFKLAEVDLQLRGPGDLFGTRQSGMPTLKMARLADKDILISARNEAARILHRDPQLSEPRHQGLARELGRFQTPAARLSL